MKKEKVSLKDKVVFDPKDYNGGAVMNFYMTIEDLYKAYDKIETGVSQRKHTGIVKKGGRFLVTTLKNCSFVYEGDTTDIRKSTKQIFGKAPSKKQVSYGGSISLFTFAVEKTPNGKRMVYKYDNRDSATRMHMIKLIIENHVPFPKEVDDEFGDTNKWLKQFWSSQSDEIQDSVLKFEDLPDVMQEMFLKSPVLVRIYDTNGDEEFAREIFTITNDSTSIKSHEAINNSFVKMVPLYDLNKSFAAVIVDDEHTLGQKEFANDIANITEAIPEEQMSYLQKAFRKDPEVKGDKSTRADVMQSILERITDIQKLDSVDKDAWTGGHKNISAQLYTESKKLTYEESLALVKETSKLLYAVCQIFPTGEEFEARHNLGLVNGCAYMLAVSELQNRAFGSSNDDVLNNCIAQKDVYQARLSQWIAEDAKRSGMLTGTPHSFRNARFIATALKGEDL